MPKFLTFLDSILFLENKKIQNYQKIFEDFVVFAMEKKAYYVLYKLIYNNPENLVIVFNNFSILKYSESKGFLIFINYILRFKDILFENKNQQKITILTKLITENLYLEDSFSLKILCILSFCNRKYYYDFEILKNLQDEISFLCFDLKNKSENFVKVYVLLLFLLERELPEECYLFIKECLNFTAFSKNLRKALSFFLGESLESLKSLTEILRFEVDEVEEFARADCYVRIIELREREDVDGIIEKIKYLKNQETLKIEEERLKNLKIQESLLKNKTEKEKEKTEYFNADDVFEM